MDLGANLRKEVVIIEIRAPHSLVHIGHEPDIGLTEDGAGAGRDGKGPNPFRNLCPRSHDGHDAGPDDPFDAAGSFQRTDQGSCTEVIDEVILVQGRFKRHPSLGDIREKNRDLGAVPQEAYPCEIFAP